MEPTTVTTLVLIAVGAGLVAAALHAWFGSWQPEPRRVEPPHQHSEVEIQIALEQMRRGIDAYERGERPLS